MADEASAVRVLDALTDQSAPALRSAPVTGTLIWNCGLKLITTTHDPAS